MDAANLVTLLIALIAAGVSLASVRSANNRNHAQGDSFTVTAAKELIGPLTNRVSDLEKELQVVTMWAEALVTQVIEFGGVPVTLTEIRARMEQQ